MDKALNGTLGQRVLQRRTARGLSQPKLAKLSGISQQNIGTIEKGGVKRPGRILELAEALHTSVEWLLEGRGPEVVRVDPREEAARLLESVPADHLDPVIQLLKSLQDKAESGVA
jgi:transcriptional regulator with XRE-family HTH domain